MWDTRMCQIGSDTHGGGKNSILNFKVHNKMSKIKERFFFFKAYSEIIISVCG